MGQIFRGKFDRLRCPTAGFTSPVRLMKIGLAITRPSRCEEHCTSKLWQHAQDTEKQKKALEMLAIKKAEELNLPLLSLTGAGEAYGKPLLALGGPSPWEYCDGSTGVTSGKYEILNARYVVRL